MTLIFLNAGGLRPGLCQSAEFLGPKASKRILDIPVAGKSPHCDLAPFPPKVSEQFPIIALPQQPVSANHAKFHQVTAAVLVPLNRTSLPRLNKKLHHVLFGGYNGYEGKKACRDRFCRHWRRVDGQSRWRKPSQPAALSATSASSQTCPTPTRGPGAARPRQCTIHQCSNKASQGQSSGPGAAPLL